MPRLAVLLALVIGSDLLAADPITMKDVVFASPGGSDLKLDFVRPAGDGPFPLVILVHGGGWKVGSRTEYAAGQQGFAKFGFATAAVQYRLTPKHTYPAQRDDITAAIEFLVKNKTKYAIDPERVGLMGGSAGGHLSLAVGFTPAKNYKVCAVVSVCGPTDLRTFASTTIGDTALKAGVGRTSSELLTDLLGSADRKAKAYTEASPVAMVRKDVPPVLTLHGDNDDLVPISQAEALHAALKKVGVTNKLIRIKDGGHDFARWPEKERTASLLAAFAFLGEHLKTK
jgi:acetyl esterase/lipase